MHRRTLPGRPAASALSSSAAQAGSVRSRVFRGKGGRIAAPAGPARRERPVKGRFNVVQGSLGFRASGAEVNAPPHAARPARCKGFIKQCGVGGRLRQQQHAQHARPQRAQARHRACTHAHASCTIGHLFGGQQHAQHARPQRAQARHRACRHARSSRIKRGWLVMAAVLRPGTCLCTVHCRA